MPLFKYLPDKLFLPLAGPNRQVYVTILARLHPLFFGTSATLLPAYETVRGEIEEVLAGVSLREWQPEEGEDAAPELSSDSSLVLASRAYRRLRQCGWLEEEADGYRIRVAMPPDVGRLLSALLEIAQQRNRLYGGMVQTIHNNIVQVRQAPAEQAAALSEAARLAREFFLHLRSLAYGLRELSQRLRDVSDPRILLGGFFSDFVEDFLVADYKTLHTRDNPFRYRSEILRLAREIRFSPEAHSTLPQAYLRLRIERGDVEALRRVDDDLSSLEQVFSDVDGHLARIDEFRSSLERRVAEAVRYMDKTQPGAAARIARVVEGLARLGDDGYVRIPAPHRLMRVLPLSPRSPRAPVSPRRPPEPERLRRVVADPERLARQKAIRDYLRRRRLHPLAVEAYLDSQMATRQSLSAGEFRIACVEDFVAFTHLPQLARLTRMGEAGRRIGLRFEVRAGTARIDTEWLACRDFTIVRKAL